MNTRTMLATVLLAPLLGCASATMLQRATADEVGGKASEIKISERIKLVDEVRWKARVGELRYSCESRCADKKCEALDPASTMCEDLTFSEVE
jgi:hypothetical protein